MYLVLCLLQAYVNTHPTRELATDLHAHTEHASNGMHTEHASNSMYTEHASNGMYTEHASNSMYMYKYASNSFLGLSK